MAEGKSSNISSSCGEGCGGGFGQQISPVEGAFGAVKNVAVTFAVVFAGVNFLSSKDSALHKKIIPFVVNIIALVCTTISATVCSVAIIAEGAKNSVVKAAPELKMFSSKTENQDKNIDKKLGAYLMFVSKGKMRRDSVIDCRVISIDKVEFKHSSKSLMGAAVFAVVPALIILYVIFINV